MTTTRLAGRFFVSLALLTACDGDPSADTLASTSSETPNDDTSVDETSGATPQDAQSPGEADDPELTAEIDPQALSTDPVVKWFLSSQPGTARLVRFDPATRLSSIAATHTFATHWIPVSVAGNKLLWQRSDTGEISLWTIDNNGNYVSHVVFSPPAAGWKVRGISLDQDGACPLPSTGNSTYTILLEGPAPGLGGGLNAQWPFPKLWHVNNAGVLTSQETLPDRYAFTQLRDFRFTPHGFGALVTRGSMAGGGGITWYGRDNNGALQRLRTDGYTATAGFSSCTAHAANVNCPVDFWDEEVPGAGYNIASFLTTSNAPPSAGFPAGYLLWTKTDGTAKAYRVGFYSGSLMAPATPVSSGFAGTTIDSFAGATQPTCPIMVDPVDPPDFPGEPVIEPPCPVC